MKVVIQKRIDAEDIPHQIEESIEEILAPLQDEVYIGLKHIINILHRRDIDAPTVYNAAKEVNRLHGRVKEIAAAFEDIEALMGGYHNVLQELREPPGPDLSAAAQHLSHLAEQVDSLSEATSEGRSSESSEEEEVK
jgi:hypothetical protein|tara:strand:- start:3666 stop:4076 length:411 start_codon:yes stop_codon:yes gene_type:complete